MYVYRVALELCGFSSPLALDIFSAPARNLRKTLTRLDIIREPPKDYRLSKIIVEWIDLERKRLRTMTKSQRSPSKTPSSKQGEPKQPEPPEHQINFVSGNTEVTSGVIHLYRSKKAVAIEDVDLTTVCIPAVPTHMAASDLLKFFALHQEAMLSLRLLRDSIPNRYIVLIKFENSLQAKEFYNEYHKRPFNLMEPDVCNVLFVEKVQFSLSEELKTLPMDFGLVELPTCPICLERMDSSATGFFSLSCNHTFHCNCLSKWIDTSCPVCRFGSNSHGDELNECVTCGETESLWMCLICGNIGCGRYHQGHAFQHYEETRHPYAIELGTQRVWDYIGDGYVHRLICNKADGKLVELPSHEDPPSSSNSSGQTFSKDKLEAVAMEYGMLLTTQLESQRVYYQEQLSLKEEEVHHVVEKVEKEKAEIVKEKEALLEGLDSLAKEKKNMEKKLQQFIAKQVQMAKELAEEKALREALASNQEKMKENESEKERRILELEEQVKDLMFYLDTQSKVESSSLKEEIQGGQVVMQEKEKEKKGRRRR